MTDPREEFEATVELIEERITELGLLVMALKRLAEKIPQADHEKHA